MAAKVVKKPLAFSYQALVFSFLSFRVAFDVFLNALGKLQVLFIVRVGSEFHVLWDVLAQVAHQMHFIRRNDNHQRVIERMGVGIIGRHRQGVATDIYRLVIAAGDAILVKTLIKSYAVILWRAVADRVNRYCWIAILVNTTNSSSISMFVALHHQVNTILTDKVIEHPSLNQVVIFLLDGIERMMKDKNLPFCLAVLQFLFQPLAL